MLAEISTVAANYKLRALDTIGGDVVCLMPTKDHPNKMTAYLAAAMMFEQVCLIADRIQEKDK